MPNAAMNSVNIFFTAALLDETSATNGRALPPARSISVTTLCADSGRMSLTPTFAPSRAKVSPISRPEPEPPPVIITTLFLSLIQSSSRPLTSGSGLGLAFAELTLPVEAAGFGAGGFGFAESFLSFGKTC